MIKSLTPGLGVLGLAVWTCFYFCPAAAGHGLNTSYTRLKITEKWLEIKVSLELTDLANHFDINANADDRVDRIELLAATPQLTEFLQRHVSLTVRGLPLPLTPEPISLRLDAAGQEFADFVFRPIAGAHAGAVRLELTMGFFERFGQDHTNLVSVETTRGLFQSVLTLDHAAAEFPPFALSSTGGLAHFLALGIKHIVIGYDHILFLIALILVGGRFAAFVSLITAFTLAHSITLLLAGFAVIALPSHWVEGGIALSIAYVAAESALNPHPRHRWWITFLFGLIHGMGFATIIREMNLPTRGLAQSLLAFNVGIEMGQVGILIALWPIIRRLAAKTYYRRLVVVTSWLIAACGVFWFIQRTLIA